MPCIAHSRWQDSTLNIEFWCRKAVLRCSEHIQITQYLPLLLTAKCMYCYEFRKVISSSLMLHGYIMVIIKLFSYCLVPPPPKASRAEFRSLWQESSMQKACALEALCPSRSKGFAFQQTQVSVNLH